MKKTLTLLLVMLLFYSCSTTSNTQRPALSKNLTGEVASSTTIDLSWKDRSTTETGFKIERKLVGETFAVLETTAANITNYRDSDLKPGTTYIYRVYPFNEELKSPVYSNEFTLTTNSTIPSINIGTQTWTTKNLDVAAYSDGTPIPQVTDPTAWANLTTGAWCYYNNDSKNGAIYGKLYNWYAVAGIWTEASKIGVRQRKKLAPTGYHIPSDAEWSTLTTYLGGASVAGGKMKETSTVHWKSPNKNATNSSNFKGLPGGYYDTRNAFLDFGNYGSWWSSSETTTTTAWSRLLHYDSDYTMRLNYNKASGFSVRLLKD